MHYFSMPIFRDFWGEHPDSETPLRDWIDIVEDAKWRNFAEMRADFSGVDKVGTLFVFNIGGNKYRLIAAIHFNRQCVYVRHILTHKEYDRGNWKDG